MAFGISATGWLVGGSILGSALIGANAAGDAVDTQGDAANRATDAGLRQYEQTRADNAGYRARGNSAGDRLAMLLGLTAQEPGSTSMGPFDANHPDPALASNPLYGSLTKQFTGADLANDPGFKFGLAQGNRAAENSASAKGGLYSGATLKALQRYGQDYGGTKFGEAFNRDRITKDALYNQLAGISGTGQLATNQVNQAGQNFANNASGNIIGAGNAQAANQIARGNILTGAVNQGLSMWQRSQAGGDYGGGYGEVYDPTGYGIGGYGGTGGGGGDYSDARLKTNIIRIGTTERGNAVYEWDWKGGRGGRGIGVLAQEVMHIPGAVSADADGWLMVDYTRV